MSPYKTKPGEDGDGAIFYGGVVTVVKPKQSRSLTTDISREDQEGIMRYYAERLGFEAVKREVFWPDLEPGAKFRLKDEGPESTLFEVCLLNDKPGYRHHEFAWRQNSMVWFTKKNEPVEVVNENPN